LTRLVAEEDKVAVHYTVEGTHQGERLCIPPTGKHFRTSGIGIYRLSEGKIAEQWEQADLLGLLQQLTRHPCP
jgi:predicted ester cyclase